MDNLTFPKIKEAIEKYQTIGIAFASGSNLDSTAGALSLYLSLKNLGKNVTVASPSSPLVEVSSLVGIDEVSTGFGGAGGDLVVSFPYKEGEIEKVSYTRDENFLNIVVKAGELGLGFDEKDVKYSRSGAAPELLFVVGTPRISDLGPLFDPAILKDTVVINIDNNSQNQGFGDIVMVSNRLSSVSEAIANLLLALNLKIDLDIAQNLMLGLSNATDNFQSESTSPLAFEIAGILMRQGATRPSQKIARRRVSEDDFIKQQERQIRVQSQESARDQEPIRQQEPVLEQAEKKEKTVENPPEDWLEPKIYKGSTNF
ncbi:MAG: hypothetical protein A3B38_04195 [Candidatus Levybacteria bacterium RIFCSPLOWO2_01_FULL_36_13]|nr:MAG: hypothetical protein A2684_01120 [Candidatus Levybacteria bacterium RIFCSPHIGHO2_01_FULL_36_15b]OGH34327.1 MAG: hypothetical protein A3B38_04195 [Candidatus Levybacteria bacterium RIFCSPLOWO2_01_FULL_36_13]